MMQRTNERVKYENKQTLQISLERIRSFRFNVDDETFVLKDSDHYSVANSEKTLMCRINKLDARPLISRKNSFLNGPFTTSFSFIFVISSKHNHFYNKCMLRNVHPVHSAVNQTHDLQNTSLLPQPVDQGSRPRKSCLVNAKRMLNKKLLHKSRKHIL